MNSSPPRRATTSPGRTHASQPFSDRDQQFVPDGVAETVVYYLEPFEIEEQNREFGVVISLGTLDQPASRWFMNSTRFGRSVSVSCRA